MDYKDIANRLRKWANGETCEDCPAKDDLAFCAADAIYDLLSEVEAKSHISREQVEKVWISVETPPTKEGWYHVAVLDLKTGKYTVEQDLYSIELAKAHGFEPGFCKANRWKDRERIDYWCRFPEPPDRRPPEEVT